MKAYLVDIGILLSEDDREFENYSIVYDKKYGYYDIDQYYVKDLEEAKKDVKNHINETDENAYGIISETFLDDDVDINDTYVEGETYDVESIVYSLAKINNELKENFVG